MRNMVSFPLLYESGHADGAGKEEQSMDCTESHSIYEAFSYSSTHLKSVLGEHEDALIAEACDKSGVAAVVIGRKKK